MMTQLAFVWLLIWGAMMTREALIAEQRWYSMTLYGRAVVVCLWWLVVPCAFLFSTAAKFLR